MLRQAQHDIALFSLVKSRQKTFLETRKYFSEVTPSNFSHFSARTSCSVDILGHVIKSKFCNFFLDLRFLAYFADLTAYLQFKTAILAILLPQIAIPYIGEM